MWPYSETCVVALSVCRDQVSVRRKRRKKDRRMVSLEGEKHKFTIKQCMSLQLLYVKIPSTLGENLTFKVILTLLTSLQIRLILLSVMLWFILLDRLLGWESKDDNFGSIFATNLLCNIIKLVHLYFILCLWVTFTIRRI